MPRVRQTIQDLTAPAMHGRGYVQQGEQRAASYLRQRFQKLGLQPLAPKYTQAFSLDVNTFPGQLQFQASAGSSHKSARRFVPGVDFIAEPNSGGGHVASRAIIFDSLVFTDAAARRRWLAHRLAGQAVVIPARQLARLEAPNFPDDSLRNSLNGAAARITLVARKLTASLSAEQSPQIRLQLLSDRWQNALPWLTIGVEANLRHQYPTQNIVGYIPGRIQPDSFLVVTAHYDHLGQMGNEAYFPGANDNASGTAMLLELAAHYTRPENRPAYSVVFLAFGAEEAGLIGSRYFVEHPLIPLNRIRFLINLDLLGTGDEGATVVNGREFPAQFQLLQHLNESQHALKSVAARGKAANSDHFPFSERGVPAFFLYTRGGIAAYHDVQDRPETLPLTAFANVFTLIRSFLDALQTQPETK
ncbi:M20/M25/M40 family metallo-hydrolase [Hymenobacter sp. BT186]|uniref:M20/M25/M40 family metallo-hydrolase n=1 Tax=Hymenobacter telluris TaxID=2816474 RepID=A0A939JB51_9BACT|nr:M20/M25/M40 family metallo-hydrolase [Hymenobacter telluris]MBO0356950.1 M20/M25/M40 family metallo-hydrolase [Hymenobacter telluris]MBW3372977.1 M20/M25/M40 family metallo-hydrolase [Hymenobacter norwichensis]